MNTQHFSYSFENDNVLGSYIQFYYLGKDQQDVTVWDDLELFLEDELGLISLEESSYEYGGDSSLLRDRLNELGFIPQKNNLTSLSILARI